MERNIFEKQRELNDRLNRYRDEYYNRNAPSVSDEVYDRLFDELKELEQETGIQMANSPTQTVGYPAVSRLEKTRHEIPLLSLDKTKSSMDLLNFMGEQQVMLMLKLDGLTVKLTYENGELLEAATRGDGDEGEIITHNTRAISGIPSHITYKERLVVTGEGFIRPSDFEELKTSLQDSSGKPYKNGRNLAAGSIRLMDAKTCQERRLVFMPFGVLEGFPHLTRKSDKLRELRALGFQPCKYLVTKQKLTLENVEAGIYQLRQYATDKDIPIDGIVVSFNDIAYAQSCGRTGHHYKDGLAYKFEDDLHESLLQYIEWTPGRTGEIAPVAVFTPVEIDGCEVSRASLHNLSFIEDLELMAGNRILVSKRNMIIPHVEENLDRGGFSMADTIPHVCPCCGQPTRIHESSGKGEKSEDRIIKTLYCDNPDCETRRLKKFVHFVSQKAMEIEGLSEATLEKFIGQGFIHSYLDIYRLDRYRAEIVRMDGMLLFTVENTANTVCKLPVGGSAPPKDWAAAAVASVGRRIWLIRYGTIKALRVYQRNVPYLSNTFRPAVIQYLQLRPFPKCPAQLIQVFDHALFSFPRPTGQSCCAVCSPFLPAAYLPKFNSWTIR